MQISQLPWLHNLPPAPGRRWSAGARRSARQHLDSADRKAHHLLDADENSSRDCEKITNLQDQTLGVHFELMLSTYMLSIDFPRRRFSSTPNEDDEDDFNKSPPAPFAPQPMNLYSTLALDINQHHNLWPRIFANSSLPWVEPGKLWRG